MKRFIFAGVIAGLLDIRDIINAAATGIVYFVFTTTLREFACWCPWHSRFHTMPILSKEYNPFDPIYLIQNFYGFMIGEGEGQEFYHGDYALLDDTADFTAEENWEAFVAFKKWQIQTIEDFMSAREIDGQ